MTRFPSFGDLLTRLDEKIAAPQQRQQSRFAATLSAIDNHLSQAAPDAPFDSPYADRYREDQAQPEAMARQAALDRQAATDLAKQKSVEASRAVNPMLAFQEQSLRGGMPDRARSKQIIEADRVSSELGAKLGHDRITREDAVGSLIDTFPDMDTNELASRMDAVASRQKTLKEWRGAAVEEFDKFIPRVGNEKEYKAVAPGMVYHHSKDMPHQYRIASGDVDNDTEADVAAVQKQLQFGQVYERVKDDKTPLFAGWLSMATGVVSPVARLFGQDEKADAANRFSGMYEEAAATVDRDEYKRGETIIPPSVKQAGRGVLSTVPPMVVAGQLGGPTAAIGLAGLQEGNRALTEGKDAGLSGNELRLYAAKEAAVEAGIALAFKGAGWGGAESMAAAKASMSGLKVALKETGKGLIYELPEEFMTEFSHNIIKESSQVDPNAMSWESSVNTATSTALQTLMTMGLVSAPSLVEGGLSDHARAKSANRWRAGGSATEAVTGQRNTPVDIAAEARKWAESHDNPDAVAKVAVLADSETVSRGAFEEAVGGPLRIGDRKLTQDERGAFAKAVKDRLQEGANNVGPEQSGRVESVNDDAVSNASEVSNVADSGSGVVGPADTGVPRRPDTGGGRAPEHGGTGVGGLGERSPAEVEQVWRATVPGAAQVKFAPGKSEMLRQIQESQGASDVGPVDGTNAVGPGVPTDAGVIQRPPDTRPETSVVTEVAGESVHKQQPVVVRSRPVRPESVHAEPEAQASDREPGEPQPQATDDAELDAAFDQGLDKVFGERPPTREQAGVGAVVRAPVAVYPASTRRGLKEILADIPPGTPDRQNIARQRQAELAAEDEANRKPISDAVVKEVTRLEGEGYVSGRDKEASFAAIAGALERKLGTPYKSQSSEALYFDTEQGQIRLALHDTVYDSNDLAVVIVPHGNESDFRIDGKTFFHPDRLADEAIRRAQRKGGATDIASETSVEAEPKVTEASPANQSVLSGAEKQPTPGVGEPSDAIGSTTQQPSASNATEVQQPKPGMLKRPKDKQSSVPTKEFVPPADAVGTSQAGELVDVTRGAAQQGTAPAPKSKFTAKRNPEPQPTPHELWKRAKEVAPESMPLIRVGDFYEAYGKDAHKVARIIGSQIATKDGMEYVAFPHQSLDKTLLHLVKAGERVAVTEWNPEPPVVAPSVDSGSTKEGTRHDAEIREPWQMTRDEYLEGYKNVEGKTDVDAVAIGKAAHVNHVKQAVVDGKQVPANVLEGYKNNGWAKTALEKATAESGITLPPFGQRLEADAAKELLGRIRDGDPTSKNRGEYSVRIDTGPMVMSKIPTNFFDSVEDEDYGNRTKFYRSSTSPDRVDRYRAAKGELPPINIAMSRGDIPVLSDGGHRLMAAIDRGDKWISALVPPKLHEQLLADYPDLQPKTPFTAKRNPEAPNAQTDTGSEQVSSPQTTEAVQPVVETETGGTAKAPVTPQTSLASRIADAVSKGPLDAKAMFKLADESYGKSRTEGGYGPSQAYDALETGVNQHIANTKQHSPAVDAPTAKQSIQALRQLVDSVPSQTNRSGTKDQLQQFSTPPDYAYAVNWLANITPADTMLEPSAGTGSIAVHAVNAGAKVYANEIEMLPDGTRNSRPDLIRSIPGIQQVFVENAEQIHNILPGKMPRPSVVVMNPPFSRSILTSKKTSGVDRKHIDSAMKLLEDNGRLVAIIGAGLHGETKGLTDWLAKSPYNVRANVELARDVYKGYGTSFPTRVLVIDKSPKAGTVVTGKAENLSELVDLLEGVRNDRPKQQPAQSTGEATPGGRKGGSKPRPSVRPATGGVDVDESSEGTAGTGTAVRTGTTGERPADVPVAPQGSDAGVGESGGTGVVSGSSKKPRVPTEGAADQTRSGDDGGAVVDQSPKVSTGTKGKLKVTKPVRKKRSGPKKLTESTYEPYEPRKFSVEGAKPHPASIVESAAMSAIDPPDVSYSPSIPQAVVESGDLSELQLETIAYAGQSHQQEIEIDGKKYRKGFMLGDGTGVGKGREIAGIITDNQQQGRKRAVWVSVDSGELFRQAKADIEGVGGNKDDLFLQNKAASGHTLPNRDGILFTTYGTLVTKASEKAAKEGNAKSRVDQIVDWVGADFDGVIAFDESHKMGSALEVEGGRGSKKMSETASAGLELQQRLPNARVVYISATSATEIHNLGYADRLGLWGKGTPFASKTEFVNKIGEGGVAAMEKVAADMKAMGVYISRNISFNDGTEKGRVEYDRIEHTLTEDQTAQWNRMSEAWLGVMENMNEALKETGADGRARGAAESAFWGANQRFWNQIITAMQTPAMMNQIEKDLQDGKSVIVQLTNTNEAAQKRALAGMAKDDSLDSVDVSPKQILIDYVESSFPVMEYEEYEDEHGNTKIRIATDANGKPIKNAAAEALREELLDDLGSIQIGGESPIDSLIARFGVDMVAEVTGRSERLVKGPDGKARREKRTKTAKKADIQAFQNGTKRILVFSEAGGTGASYHASLAAKNQQKRHHYLLQAGWKANAAIQGLGRSHRSNQAQAPTYFLVTTNLKGQKRFISTIARRLSQLGALTKGQRSAGESGVFSAADNLESTEAAEALRTFFKDLYHGAVEGFTIESFEEKTGLRLRNEKDGSLKADLPTISRFLNRVLNLDVDTQNGVFEQFDNRLKEKVAVAEAAGTLDQGMETIHADKITKTDDRVVYRHESGAETRYVKATIENRAKPITWQALNDGRDIERFVHRKKAGDVVALERTGTSEFNPKTGALETKVRVHTPMGYTISTLEKFGNDTYYESRTPKAAESAWNQQVKDVPEFVKRDEHLLTGVLLPIWDRIKGRPRVVRMMTSEGETLLGRIIDPNEVNETLRKLGAEENRPDMSAEDAVDRLLQNEITLELANGWTVRRSRVQNENRIELVGPSFTNNKQLDADGVFWERIASNTRYFIPTGDTASDVLGKVIEANPIVDVKTLKQDDETSAFAIDETKQKFSAKRKDDAEPISSADIIKTWERDFDVPIRRGKVGSKKGVQGIYKHLVEVVRLRKSEDVNLRVASHEVAHHVDQKTDAVKSMSKATKDVFAKLDYEPEKGRPKEGWAEFVSRYVMGEDVKTAYPEAYNWFSTQWATAHPEMAAKLGKAARYAQQYANQGAFARAKMLFPGREAAPVDSQADDYKKAMQSYWNRSLAEFVDQNRAFYLLDEAFRKAGGKFRNREATYELKLATDFTAPAHAERAMLEGVHTVSQEHKILGPSIAEALKDIKSYDDYQRAQAYAVALFTVEMADVKPGYNTGMRLDDAEFIIEEVEKNADELKRYEHFAKTLTDYNNALVEMAYDAGSITAKDRKYILGKTKHYVPLHREIGGKRAKHGLMAGAGMVNLPPAFRRRSQEGSGLPIVDIVEATMRRTMDQYARAMKQQVVHSVVTTVDPKLNGGVKGLGKLAERLSPDMLSNVLRIDEALDDLVREGLIDEDTAKEVKIVTTLREGRVPSSTNIKWLAERYGVDADSDTALDDLLDATNEVADGAGLITYWRPSYMPNAGKNIVRLVVNGEPQMYQLDDVLFDAMSSMGQLELGAFGEAVKSFNHAFKTGAVGLSTGFGGANVVRDWWDAQAHSVNQGAESTYMPFVMLGKYAYAEVESLRSGGKAANEFVRLFKEYGGELTTRLGYDTKSQRSEKRKMFGGADATSYLLDHPIQSIASIPGKGLKTAERIITMTDVGPRLAEFVAVMKKHGYSLNEKGQIVNKYGDVTRPPRRVIVAAINAAGDATVNFKRVGRTMRKIDAYVPFTNAALQSRVRQVMAYKSLGNGMSDVQAQRVAIMTLAFGALGAAAFFAYRDDDDNEERAEWLKGSHFVLFNGTVRVPKSRDYRFITNMVEAIMEDTIGGKEGKAKEQAIEEAKELMFGGGGVLREAFEQTSNYDQFREAPIESQWDARLHPWARYDEHTSLPAKHLGNITGHLLGISPKRIDHLLDSTTGGMYRRLNRTGENLLNGTLGPKDIPVVNAFWMDKDYQQSLGDFYDAKWESEKDVNTAKKEDRDSTDAKAASKTFDDYESLMTDLRDAEGEEPTGENEKYIIGLARAALNREPLDNYPNPLLADLKALTPAARPVVQKYLDELWKTGYGETKAGKPYGEPIPGPNDTHETYRDRYGKWVAKRKEAQDTLTKRQGMLKRVSK